MKPIKPQPKTEAKFWRACKKYVNNEASFDYLIDYIIKNRLINIKGEKLVNEHK